MDALLKRMTVLMAAWLCLMGTALAAETITDDELASLMGKGKVIVIDVRTIKDWSSSDREIKGAVREDPQGVQDWARKYSKDDTIVLYCA